MSRLVLLLLALTCSTSWAQAEDAREFSQEQLAFFETKIRPVLVEYCLACHSNDDKQKGGLSLTSRAGLLRGGESGPAIAPGKPDASLLLEALRYESYEMPPKGKLPARVIDDFAKWIAMGAPDPRVESAPAKKAEPAIEVTRLWSLQPLSVVEPPQVDDVSDPIDRFIRGRLRREGLEPADPAPPRVLLRRLYLDLTGLPPTSEQVEAFEQHSDFEAVVDRLLDSPEFGERWARHWLDLSGYADTIGVGRSIPALEAWRYRDYVINAFNLDKPFDEFIRQQIAGDIQVPSAPGVPLGPEPTVESIVATGFLAIGPWELVGGDKVQLRMDVVDRQVNRVGKAFLGMTLECARCHDHKFDPVSQRDYYALAGLFRSTVTLNGRINGVFSAINQTPLPESTDDLLARAERVRTYEAELVEETRLRDEANRKADEFKKQITRLSESSSEAADTESQPTGDETTKAELEKQRDAATAVAKKHSDRIAALKYLKHHRTRSLALAVMDGPEPEDSHINIRGNAHQLGELVPRGFPVEIAPKDKPALTRGGSGRVQLAEWLTDPRNPLTARVWVNRVWHHLFGAGLVRTVDNFGFTGEAPSHPELLDYLASEFMKNGWSTKQLVRRIVLSRTWRQSSVNPRVAVDHDPENRLLARANRRRLEAEVIRDSMLLASGQLNRTRGGPSLPVDVPGNLNPGGTGNMSDGIRLPDSMKFRRTIYLPQKRKGPFDALDFLGAFDLPDPNHETGRRNTTTVPTQALYLLNSPFVQQCAKAVADRVMQQSSPPRERVIHAYRDILGRKPTDSEADDALAFVSELQSTVAEGSTTPIGESPAWSRLSQSLLISNEFLFRE
jgi:cytochrome c553